jgi:hypothetical protein
MRIIGRHWAHTGGNTKLKLIYTIFYYYYYYYFFLTAIGLTPGGSSTVQYTFTHKEYTEYRERNIHNNKKKKKIGKCGPCPVFASYALAFALQLRKKHGKTSVRVVEKKSLCNTQYHWSKITNKCVEIVVRLIDAFFRFSPTCFGK